MFVLYAPDPATPLVQVDSYCFADGDAEVVTAASITPDARNYASQVGVAKPILKAWPPGGSTLVNLPTFFAVAGTSSAERDFGGEGYTMHLQVGASNYAWSFGDGVTLTSDEPGSAPPDGPIHHTYRSAGAVNVAVTVNYGATYSLITPFGTIGPLQVDGGPVKSLPATDGLQVKEAIATLTQ